MRIRPRMITTWISVHASLSAMTRATPTGSSRGVTGCRMLPTAAPSAPTIAHTEPILQSQYLCSDIAMPPNGLNRGRPLSMRSPPRREDTEVGRSDEKDPGRTDDADDRG